MPRNWIRRQQVERRKQKESDSSPATTLLIELDGVILDSYPILYDVYCALLEHYGREGSSLQFQEISGLPYTSFIWALIYQQEIKASFDEILGWYRSFMVQHYISTIPLIAGAEAFLDLADAQSWRLALIAAQPRSLLLPFESKEQSAQFELIVPGDAMKASSETIPNLYEHALLRLGCAPEEALSIVTSRYGCLASEAAGVRSLFLTKQRGHPPSHSHKRCRAVYSWDEIQTFLH